MTLRTHIDLTVSVLAPYWETRRINFLFLLLLLRISPNCFAQLPSQAPLQTFMSAGGATGNGAVPSYFASVGQPAVYARPVSTNNGGGVMTTNELMFPASTVVAALPTAQPTALTFSNVTTTSLSASFSAATGPPSGYIALRKAGSAPAATTIPVIATAYSVGNVIVDATVA